MAKAAKKRGRGRPPSTGIGKMYGLRMHPPLVKRVLAWATKQEDKPKMSEAMRRLIERGLGG